MAAQASRLEFAHSSNFTTEVAEEFARELLEFAGPAFEGGAVFFTCGGSEAVESALKLARQFQVESGHSERYQVISRRQSYHGATLGAMAVSGNPARREIYLPMVREFPKATIPYCYRCPYDCGNECADCGLRYAAEVEEAIAETNGSAAAFIMEPVSGATFAVTYNYTSLGFLRSVTDASDNKVYWAAKATNAAGQVIDEFTRNGVETRKCSRALPLGLPRSSEATTLRR